MTLLLQRLVGPTVIIDFVALSSGNTISNQFLQNQQSGVAPVTVETAGQTPAAVNFELWRLQGAFTIAGSQQATMTARINGISQAATATVVGTGAGAVTTDLASSIAVLATDLLSILFVTAIASATNTRPRCWLIGAASSTI